MTRPEMAHEITRRSGALAWNALIWAALALMAVTR